MFCLKVEVGDVVVAFLSELKNGIGLANLSCPLDDKRLAVFVVPP